MESRPFTVSLERVHVLPRFSKKVVLSNMSCSTIWVKLLTVCCNLGVFTGCVVLLALKLLSSCLQYIPKASLAAIIIVSVVQMVDVGIIKRIWQTNRTDVIPLVVTFFACLYKLDVGILCGIAVALVIVLYRHFVPRIEIQGREVCHVGVNGGLNYMGTEHFISQVRQNAVLSEVKPEVVVIECAAMPECDFTVLQGISQIVQDCKDHDVDVIFSNVQDNVKQMLVNGGLPMEPFKDYLDEEHCNLLSLKTEVN